jgi:hypothetical protein
MDKENSRPGIRRDGTRGPRARKGPGCLPWDSPEGSPGRSAATPTTRLQRLRGVGGFGDLNVEGGESCLSGPSGQSKWLWS